MDKFFYQRPSPRTIAQLNYGLVSGSSSSLSAVLVLDCDMSADMNFCPVRCCLLLNCLTHVVVIVVVVAVVVVVAAAVAAVWLLLTLLLLWTWRILSFHSDRFFMLSLISCNACSDDNMDSPTMCEYPA